MHWKFEIHGYYLSWYCSIEWFGRVWKVWGIYEKSISSKMPRSQISWKTLESPGSNQRHLTDRKILRFINSAKSSTTGTKQMVQWWILDACLSNQRRKSRRMLIMDIRRNAKRFVIDLSGNLNTFKIRFRAVYTQAYGGACRRNRTRNTQLPNANTIDIFFWSEKKGGSSAPSEPPLATCLPLDQDLSPAWVSFKY